MSILVEFYRHNLWANLRLIDALGTLSDDLLDAVEAGTYGSIRTTLGHLVGAEEPYVMRLRGETPTRPPLEDGDIPRLGDLREIVRRSGEALIEIGTRANTDWTLQGTWRGEPYSMPASVILLQAVNHATEHRGQIASILGRHGIEPPELDAWAWDEDAAAGP